MKTLLKVLKTTLKVILWTFAVVFVVLILAIATTPLWVGPLATKLANKMAPQYTGTDFHVEKISINPFSGKLRVYDCHLSNPAGYSQPEAFSVSTAAVDIAMGSLFTKKIEIKSIVIRGLYASYISKNGTNNFAVIAENATHAKAKLAAEEAGMTDDQKKAYEEKLAKAADARQARADAESAIAATNGTATKVVIDLVDVADSKVTTDLLKFDATIPLPSITLHDIGKDDPEGTTVLGAIESVWNAILKSAVSAGGSISDAAGAVGQGASKAADAVGKGAGAVIDSIGGLFGGKKK